ncbi:MAG: hypothetical protein ACKPGN_00085, partial [Dolichospermum sp.]
MFNLRWNLQRLFQVLYRYITGLLRNLWGVGNPRGEFAKTCETLQKQIAIPEAKDKAWKNYEKALSLARQCSCEELLQVIFKFDPLLSN